MGQGKLDFRKEENEKRSEHEFKRDWGSAYLITGKGKMKKKKVLDMSEEHLINVKRKLQQGKEALERVSDCVRPIKSVEVGKS